MSEIKVNTVSEQTADSGVTADGVLLKDGAVSGAGKVDMVGNLETDGVVLVDDVQVLGAQVAAIADAVVAHDVNAAFSDVEVEAALNALGVKINAILAALRAHGIIAT